MRHVFHPLAIATLLLGALTGVGSAIAGDAIAGPAPPPASIPRPPAAPVRPVSETLWGRKVTDDYRYMEKLDPSTIAWMKAQGAYTRSVLDSIAPLGALERKVAAFSGSFGLVQGYVEFGGRAFYEERAPGSDNFDLLVSDHAGKRKLVDVAALRAANGGKPYAINYFLASPDGSKVAVGISEGGSEDASLTVYLAASGAKIAGPIDRAQFGATSWSDDSKTLYFVRLKKLAPGAPRPRNIRIRLRMRGIFRANPFPSSEPRSGTARNSSRRSFRPFSWPSARPWPPPCRSTACRTSSRCGSRRWRVLEIRRLPGRSF